MLHKSNLGKKKLEPYMLRGCIIFAVCSLIYYLPTLVGLAGGS